MRRVFPERERRAFFVAALRAERRSSAPGNFSEYPGRFCCGAGGCRGSAASRRIGRRRGEGVEGCAAALRGALRAVSCRGFRLGRGTADSERRLQSRSAEGEWGDFCGAGRRSRGGGESRRASQGKCRSSAGGKLKNFGGVGSHREEQGAGNVQQRGRRGPAPGKGGMKDRGPRPEERAAEWRRAGFGRWAARRRAMFGKEAEAAVAFFVGEGRKSPNRREEGEGRRSATPSRMSQAREASAWLHCGGFEYRGSVGAAQQRGAGSLGRFFFALPVCRGQKFQKSHGNVAFTYKERTLPPRTEAPCPAPLREEQSRLSVTFRLPRIGWRQNGRVI